MDKNKKNKIIGLSIGILLVLIIVVSSTYAYWQITKTQKTPNDIVAACLDITMENETGTFGLDKAWPISGEEGESLVGYTFEVKNNCQDSVNYIVGLNSVEGSSDNYLDYSSLRLKLDDKESSLISDFGDIGYSDPENKEVVRDSKLLSMESLEGKSTATHNVKVWIDKDAPVTEQGKTFSGQIFITGGQGVPIYDDCFAINTDGAIMGYDYSCGYAVEVPATIAGIEVKTINQASFAVSNMQVYGMYNEETEEGKEIYYYTDENTAEDFINFAKQEFCEDPTTCTLADIEAMGLKIITTEEEYNAIDWDEYEASGYNIEGPMVGYFNLETGEMEEGISQVTSLDLSKAVNLETIGENAFIGYDMDEDTPECEGKYIEKYECKYSPLTRLILPENEKLTMIGESAFEGANLGELVIPSTVNELGAYAFASSGINNLVFEDTEENPSQLVTIADGTFSYNKISNVVFPKSVTSVGGFDNNSLTNVTLPKSLTTIGNGAFQGNRIVELVIPASVQSIGNNAFALKNYHLGDNSGTVEKVIFEDAEDVPSQLISIGAGAFINNKLKEVDIPGKVEQIGNQAFEYNEISKIIIPDSVKTIDNLAFAYNGVVSNLIISKNNSLTSIGYGAFSNLDIENAIISTEINLADSFSGNTKIKNLIISSNVKTISGFSGKNIETITFEDTEDSPSQLTRIEASAFYNNLITELSIPESVEFIGANAFDGNDVMSLIFEDSDDVRSELTVIDTSAFSGASISSLIIPPSVQTIGDNAFLGNEIATLIFKDTVEAPSELISIGKNTFSSNRLIKVVLPGSITSIGDYAFSFNDTLTDIIIKKEKIGITFGSSWNIISTGKYANVTYDPNYTE